MANETLSDRDWAIRTFIYEFFVSYGRPPTAEDTAWRFVISAGDALAAYRRLADAHQLVLEEATDDIRMATPLSAVATDYRVQVNGVWLYANCAWDSVGIPAMCHADAIIEATLPVSRETVTYHVKDGNLVAEDGPWVHFALPARQWYDNIVHT